jgi:hypothetical protein
MVAALDESCLWFRRDRLRGAPDGPISDCLRKTCGVEAFDHHYREVHLPFERKLPGLRRYTVSPEVRPIRVAFCYRHGRDAGSIPVAPGGQVTAQDVMDHLARWSPGIRSAVFELEDLR